MTGPFPKQAMRWASFLGMCNSYRRLIPHFAEDAEPLYNEVLELNGTASDVLEIAFAKRKDEL